MNADDLALVLKAVAGVLVLFFGRRLFWLFVALVGFAGSVELAPLLLPESPPWVVLTLGLAAGLLGGVLAVGFQYALAGVAGFVAGSLILLPLANALQPVPGYAVTLAGGIAGAVFLVWVFDWALVGLSALAGSAVVVQSFGLAPPAQVLAMLVLAGIGAAFQAAALRPPQRAS